MDLLEAADRLRHDLGKYSSFSVRFLEEGAGEPALRDALRDDLCRTRRGPAGEAGVAEVWASLRPLLSGGPPGVERHMAALDAAVAALSADAGRLDTLDREALADLAHRAHALGELTRAVAGWLRQHAGGLER